MGKAVKGHARRPSVMDKYTLPDLSEFIATFSVLVRGCETNSPKELGLPPTSIHPNEKMLLLPNKDARELLDRHFFGSMIDMDYNREVSTIYLLTRPIFQYIGYHRNTSAHLLGRFEKVQMGPKFVAG